MSCSVENASGEGIAGGTVAWTAAFGSALAAVGAIPGIACPVVEPNCVGRCRETVLPSFQEEATRPSLALLSGARV